MDKHAKKLLSEIKINKITAAQILAQLEKKHTQKPCSDIHHPALQDAFYSEVKNGPSWGQKGSKLLILDAVAIKRSWSKPCITGYEIKVSRSDFLRGKETALKQYTKYCHEFYFVCPPGVVTLEDLAGPEGKHGDIGLIYYSPEHDTLYTKRRAMYRKIDLRSPEVVGMLFYLAMYRAGKEKVET